jgi:hypothetical protein
VVKKGNSASSTSGGWRNLAWPLKPSQTFTDAQLRASRWAVSLPGTATVLPTNRRALQWVVRSALGDQPPEPRPVHHAIIQKVRSVLVHQSWDQETEKQLQSQGYQNVK